MYNIQVYIVLLAYLFRFYLNSSIHLYIRLIDGTVVSVNSLWDEIVNEITKWK